MNPNYSAMAVAAMYAPTTCVNSREITALRLRSSKSCISDASHFKISRVGGSIVEGRGMGIAAKVMKDLQVTEMEQDNDSRVHLKVNVPANVCKNIYDELLQDLSKTVKMKGFRPGHVPEWALLSHFGQRKVTSEAVRCILEKTLPEAMNSISGRALSDTEEIVSKFDSILAEFSPSSPLSYIVAVDVMPKVKWISEGAYKNMCIQVEAEDDDAVQKAADREFQTRYKDLGFTRVVTNRGIEMKDLAIIDLIATRVENDGRDGEEIMSCGRKGFSVDTEEVTSFVPGFMEALMGLERGQTHSFVLEFPNNWDLKELRGVKARFKVECKEIFNRVLPELNEEIFEKICEGCKSVDEVKAALLKKHKLIENKARVEATKQAILDELVKITDVEVPTALIQEQGYQMYGANLIELQVRQNIPMEKVVELSSQEMVDDFIRNQRHKIVANVKQSLAISEIFKLENLEYSEDELNEEVKKASEELKIYKQEEYDEKRVREQAEEFIEASKVMEWLIQHANIRYMFK